MLPCLFFLNIDGGVQMASRAPANLSAPTKAPDGLTWEEVSNTSVQAGIAVHNVGLEAALPLRLQFKKEELDTWKVPHLRHDSYVRVGDKWYRPAAAHSVLSQVHGNTSFPSQPQKEGGSKGGRTRARPVQRAAQKLARAGYSNVMIAPLPNGAIPFTNHLAVEAEGSPWSLNATLQHPLLESATPQPKQFTESSSGASQRSLPARAANSPLVAKLKPKAASTDTANYFAASGGKSFEVAALPAAADSKPVPFVTAGGISGQVRDSWPSSRSLAEGAGADGVQIASAQRGVGCVGADEMVGRGCEGGEREGEGGEVHTRAENDMASAHGHPAQGEAAGGIQKGDSRDPKRRPDVTPETPLGSIMLHDVGVIRARPMLESLERRLLQFVNSQSTQPTGAQVCV
jgi:hypothetical protein